MDKNIEDIREKLLKIEAESGIFDFKVNGIKLWQYIRVSCLNAILEDVCGVALDARPYPRRKDSTERANLKEWIASNPFLLRKKDLLVVNHPRRIKEGKYYRCYVTETLLENIDYSYYVFEYDYLGQHFKPVTTKNLKYMDYKIVKKLLSLKPINTVALVKPFMDTLLNIIVDKHNIELSTKCKRMIFEYVVVGYEIMRRVRVWSSIVLSIVRPKAVLVTVPYSLQVCTLVAEAKKRKIPTIELQHGIAIHHMAYNCLYEGRLETYVDYIFAYSKFDKVLPRYPIPSKNVIPVGYPDLEKKAKMYKNIKKKGKVLLILSSAQRGYIGDFFINFALELRSSEKLQDVKIIYKLHPTEYDGWEERFPRLKNSGLDIIADNRHDIYYYLAQSDFVLGINTTVLYEATEFDTNIFILKKGTYEDVKVLYENGFAELVEDADKVIDKITHPEKNILKRKGYFEKNAIENMKREIQRIIS